MTSRKNACVGDFILCSPCHIIADMLVALWFSRKSNALICVCVILHRGSSFPTLRATNKAVVEEDAVVRKPQTQTEENDMARDLIGEPSSKY